jgi:hypothetical protein
MTPSIWIIGRASEDSRGNLPKIREEIVSELEMVFEFFRFDVSDVDGSC